ncbi:hypothetical protein ACIBO2_57245 [Nonomuraea sp. NPDC050022]
MTVPPAHRLADRNRATRAGVARAPPVWFRGDLHTGNLLTVGTA